MDEKKVPNSQLEKYDSPEAEAMDIDPVLDHRLTRKFDLYIVPWLFGLWLLAFIDRSNIGNARIDGLTADLHMDGAGNEFNVALAIFYVPYVLVDVPSNWLVKVRIVVRQRHGSREPDLIRLLAPVSTCPVS